MNMYGSRHLWFATAVLTGFGSLAMPEAEAAPRRPPAVLLDGQPLPLEGATPLISGDRVLVPMRAIFEALDASVEWDAATTTITAKTAGNRTISLQPGIKSAAIDGRLVRLDQPPLLNGGRVLVPLRFVSEALGATVTWDAPRSTVAVYRSSPLQIQSVEVTGPATLRAGQTVEVLVKGASGAKASWRLLPGPSGLPLTEIQGQPGSYHGSYTVREGDDFPLTQPMVRLERNGQQAEKVADQRLTVDTLPPRLTQQALSQMDGDEFQAVVNVDESSDPATWKVSAGYLQPGESGLVFSEPLAVIQEGTQIKLRLQRQSNPRPPVVEVRDAAGNRSQITLLLPGVEPPAEVPVNVDQKLTQDNEAVELAVQAAPGAEIWAEIFDPATQDIVGTIPLQMGPDGRYIGTLPLDQWELPDDSQVRVQSRFGNLPPHITVIPLGPPNWNPPPRPWPRPRPRPDRDVELNDVRVYGDNILGQGDVLRIEARGTERARVTADLGPGFGQIPLTEERGQRGSYRGEYTARRGDNARGIRPEVRLERGGRRVERRANRSFDFDTEPPRLRSTSIRQGQEFDALPERIDFRYGEPAEYGLYRVQASLNTTRGKFQVASQIQDGDVRVSLDRGRIRADGAMTLELQVVDAAGNAVRDTLEFKVRPGAAETNLEVTFDLNRPLQPGEEFPIVVNVEQWRRGRVTAALVDANGQWLQPAVQLTGNNGRFQGKLRAPAVQRQQEFTVAARLVDGNDVLGNATSRRRIVVQPQAAQLGVEIVSVQPANNQPLKAGDTVTVRARSLTGARVTWTLGDFMREQVLREQPAGSGLFEGRYTIQPNDRGTNIPLRVRAQRGTEAVTQDAVIRPGIVATTNGPNIQLISPNAGATFDEAPAEFVVQITAENGVADVAAQIARNGVGVEMQFQAQGNRIRIPVPQQLRRELVGEIRLRVQAKDNAGNLSRQNFRFFINPQQPVPQPQPNPGPAPQKPFVEITSPRENDRVTIPVIIRGRANPGALIQVGITLRTTTATNMAGLYQLRANAQGIWEAPPLDVDKRALPALRQIIVNAAARGDGGEVTDRVVVRYRQ